MQTFFRSFAIMERALTLTVLYKNQLERHQLNSALSFDHWFVLCVVGTVYGPKKKENYL